MIRRGADPTTDTRWSRARTALRRILRPPITITDPPAGALAQWDVPVPMRDGVHLRANVFRPLGDGPFPVLLCAHPYGKDDIPLHHRTRRGYRPSLQYRLMRSAPVTHSAWTSWEAPDPAHWVGRGYVVVNADLRGWGTSEGEPTALSAQEGLDVHDLVQWAGTQPWSNGRVGMSGVSYLALSQWAGAATRPSHLAAICPWEGFTDCYRDFARPGGILETGFLTVWGTAMRRRSRGRVDLLGPARRRREFDQWWADRDRDLARIDVPALICGSFSDHNLHTAGSFEGFRRIGSAHRWLYTHRGPKWATYYSPEALAAQARFFDHFVKGQDTGIADQLPVRLEIRDDRTTITRVGDHADWPPPGIGWRTLHCRPDGTLTDPGTDTDPGADTGTDTDPGADTGTDTESDIGPTTVGFAARRGRISFTHRFAADTDVVGPMELSLTLSVDAGDDLSVFAGVRKFRDGREITFEGSYGFQGDLVTHGLLLAGHRALDPSRSRDGVPWHPHTAREPLVAGRPVRLRIGLLPSATHFRAGDELRLDVQAHWFHGRNPLLGQFPAGYRRVGRGTATLHLGAPGCDLRIPVLDRDDQEAPFLAQVTRQ
ncbi:MAG TPA: CocE/NonD family hydrolase [Nakamurella multipartita]|nr:CocE/NonD family hydrolase [Nakamurella multipartita]